MKLSPTENFKRQYKKLPPPIKDAAKKQLAFLLANPQHPSLNIKK
jgi:mRNA-degrading endonuclease RelE of RelBE toxin-antitoxin system